MKKIFLVILSIIIIAGFVYESFGSEVNMKISEYEENILEAASSEVPYKAGLTIDTAVIDPIAKVAISEAEKYTQTESAKYRTPETNVYVNLKGTYKKTEISLAANLADYAGLIDNIIINANGLYCYIKPSEFKLKKTDTDTVLLKINDENNVVARYNGTAKGRSIKFLLMILFAVTAIYIIVFMLILRKLKLKAGADKKIFDIMGGCFFTASVILFSITFFVDFSANVVKKPIKLKEGTISCFNIELSSSSQAIRGIYIGIPPYEQGLDPNFASVFRQSTDPVKGDTALGGNYLTNMNIIRFPIEEKGSYYIRNNNVSFSDVNQSDSELYEAVSILAAKNILSGKSDNVFGTEDTVTRAETVTMLCKMLNIGIYEGKDDFEDISNSDWFYTYAIGAKESGVLSGYDDNTFRARNTITRQEFVTLMGQIMQNRMGYVLPEDYSALSVYSDGGDIADWAKPYVSLMEREGVSIWQDAFLPSQPITRGEAAMLLYRVYCLYD